MYTVTSCVVLQVVIYIYSERKAILLHIPRLQDGSLRIFNFNKLNKTCLLIWLPAIIYNLLLIEGLNLPSMQVIGREY